MRRASDSASHWIRTATMRTRLSTGWTQCSSGHRSSRRKRRLVRSVIAVAAVASAFVSVAAASDPDLLLNPAKWIVLDSGSTDSGRGAYVHAKRIGDGSQSTFMVEHDAGLSPYNAFL